MSEPKIWWLVQVFSCFFLTGLIWVIQLVHYPSFAYIERKRFAEFERFHERRITWIVGAVMPAELGSAILLVLYAMHEAKGRSFGLWLNLVLLGLIWASTAVFSVPCHRKLEVEFLQKAWRGLVATNWIRTILWSMRSLLLIKILIQN